VAGPVARAAHPVRAGFSRLEPIRPEGVWRARAGGRCPRASADGRAPAAAGRRAVRRPRRGRPRAAGQHRPAAQRRPALAAVLVTQHLEEFPASTSRRVLLRRGTAPGHRAGRRRAHHRAGQRVLRLSGRNRAARRPLGVHRRDRLVTPRPLNFSLRRGPRRSNALGQSRARQRTSTTGI
jgi:hypothetical protein